MPPRLPLSTISRPLAVTKVGSTIIPLSSRRAASTHTETAHDAHAHDAHAHEEFYDPPSGWLWGIPPGEKPKKEGWETLCYVGLVAGLAAAGVAYAYKPDTSIQTWALEEARRRLEAEGIIPEIMEKK